MELNIFMSEQKQAKLLLIKILVTIICVSVPAVAISKTSEFGVEYETLGFQYDLIDSLFQNDVPFYIDNEGLIKIKNKYADIAQKLMHALETRPTAKVANRKYASAVALLFNKNGIAYTVREDTKTGNIHFMWSKDDDEIARRLTGQEFMKVIQESYKNGKLGEHSVESPK